MENTHLWVPKEGLGKNESAKFSESKPKKLDKGENCHRDIVVNMIQSQISKVSFKDFFFPRFHGKLDNRIPKNMVSVDEKYLRGCLELIRISALKGAQCNIAVNSRSTSMAILPEPETLNSGQFTSECPVEADSGLFDQFGGLENHENLSRMKFADAKGLTCYENLSVTSSFQLENETPMIKGQKFGSMSSFSSRLSFASSTMSQGMLQCTWKEGIPHFVFSADDQKEVYVTKLRKANALQDKALDFVYLFHLDKNSQLVGKMNVSTSFTLGSNNDKVRETGFVLFGSSEIYDKEMYSSSIITQRKNKGVSKKVYQVFRTSPLSKVGGSNSPEESCVWEPYAIGGTNLFETNVPPNLELAAIVVKTHNAFNPSNEVGGWGLKFLNKSGLKQSTLSSESCMRSGGGGGDCSTSMSILIPAGIHGGPRTKNGGPSSLTDRWRSGGRCDCGGWDEGCPLTVLQRRSDVLSEENMQGECKIVDVVTQGSRDFIPTLRMVNVHDGLYFIHFRPPLSALQSFSIAVAIIHAESYSAQELR